MYKAGDLSKRLGVHPNTIRNWADEYEQFMTPGAIGRAPGAKRRFSQDDALILATIAAHRNEGLKLDQITEILRAGKLVSQLPPAPTPEEQAARGAIALISRPEYDRLADRALSLSNELEKALTERNEAIERWQVDTTALNARINHLEHELGVARGRLQELESERQPAGYWLNRLALVFVLAVAVTVVIALLLLSQAPR